MNDCSDQYANVIIEQMTEDVMVSLYIHTSIYLYLYTHLCAYLDLDTYIDILPCKRLHGPICECYH